MLGGVEGVLLTSARGQSRGRGRVVGGWREGRQMQRQRSPRKVGALRERGSHNRPSGICSARSSETNAAPGIMLHTQREGRQEAGGGIWDMLTPKQHLSVT